MQLTFNNNALRVKKARLAQRLKKTMLLILELVTTLLLLGGLYLLWVGIGAGYFVLAPAILVGMLLLWNQWDLQHLDTQLSSGLAASGKLDQMLQQDVLAKFIWPARYYCRAKI